MTTAILRQRDEYMCRIEYSTQHVVIRFVVDKVLQVHGHSNQQAGGKRFSYTESQSRLAGGATDECCVDSPTRLATFRMGRHGARQRAASSRRNHRKVGSRKLTSR